MSTLLSAHSLSFDNAFGPLFEQLSFTLSRGDRIGLIGHNGCGKSTLLRLLSGELASVAGTVTLANHCIMAHIEQHLPAALMHSTLIDAVIARLPVSEQQSDGWQAEIMLDQLGFDQATWQQPVNTLSGGEHTRLLLARALILQPDLLLLDEPSNHLDLPTLLWLEQFLAQWHGSFVLVSHDRYLLDRVTQRSWILRDRTLHSFQLPCSHALEALDRRDETDALRNQAEQREIERIAKSAKRLAVWGAVYDNEDLSRKAKQMEKRIDKLKDEQTALTAGVKWRLTLQGEPLPADRLLEVNNAAISAEVKGPALFTLNSLKVKSGDRLAIIGANGGGKSSLLRAVWRAFQQPQPDILFHPRVEPGYYDQQLMQLEEQDTLSDALSRFAQVSSEQRKMALISAGFAWARHQQRVSTLSGGERSRLLFVGLSLGRYSLLLLDEPTNHLDLDGKEQLAQTLNLYPGAALIVSHDRDLIASSCNRFLLINDRKIEEWHDPEKLYAALGGLNGK
ncbi:ABC-F family ATP-binding cassette domain-containing protein [Erwinia pyri]|uniref:ABC-F family ATP-binding cassette domain-containing protein n=1 Tax=Erwinia pyri TaxID=3062598 RepID=A0AA50DPQ0_9GAMM|nr:ABC-F family ATP-binding cassette domain-containing protein [Erwinia sp. DE2]WLS80863.1 ABC-F family ATP-binding cassette domain-containing protein [Erwinia sp. DE2]